MNLKQHVKEAISNLMHSKLQSFLAILGILVGTGSVVALVSSSELATEHALAQFKKLGTDLLSINMYQPYNPEEKNVSKKENFLKLIEQIQNNTPAIKDLAPYALAFQPIAFNGHKLQGSLIGTTESLKNVVNINMASGRFISFLDKNASYCVIGYQLGEEIKKLAGFSPIGQQLQIGSSFFTIIGVADSWMENSFFNQDINRSVIMTIPAVHLLSQHTQINNIVLRLKPGSNFEAVEESIKKMIQRQIPHESIFFRSPQQIIHSMGAQRKTLTLLLALIGSISLLVGGIGVMNIMLVSVIERRREIGIRMAVGAKRGDIQALFLVESVTLALFGGVCGVLLGVFISFLIAYFAHWEFILLWLPPLAGFFVSVIVGIFFGVYPAYQASQLDPIKTLRSD